MRDMIAKPGRCAECVMGAPFYIPCNKPATKRIGWTGRSDPPILMCHYCADHNVKNRGGEVLCTFEIVPNVDDRRRSYVGSWTAEPLVFDDLLPEHVGRTVIYRDHGRAEAGTITSWRDGVVFVWQNMAALQPSTMGGFPL